MAMNPTDDNAEPPEWRTTTFFNYWRVRLNFVRELDLTQNWHEANVLLWAALDALGNLWAKRIGRSHVDDSGGLRRMFDAFLARYGGEPFQRISLPDVWHRAELQDCKLPPTIREYCQRVERRPSTVLNRHLRQVSDDPELATLMSRLGMECQTDDADALGAWLSVSRYGSIAYKRMRSSFLHEGRPGDGTHSFDLYGSATAPTYLSMKYDAPALIGFAPQFMAEVLQRCIDAFEQEALELQQDPVPLEGRHGRRIHQG
jgi:hypothetical protein